MRVGFTSFTRICWQDVGEIGKGQFVGLSTVQRLNWLSSRVLQSELAVSCTLGWSHRD